MGKDLKPVDLRAGRFIQLLEKYKFDEHLESNQDYYYRILKVEDEKMMKINPKAYEHDLLTRLEKLAKELYDQVNGPLETYIIDKNPAGHAYDTEIREAKAAFTYMCTSKFLRLRLCGQSAL